MGTSKEPDRAALRFRPATRDDTAAAQSAYRRIVEHLAATVDYPHWHTENRPAPAQVDAWIAAGQLHFAVADLSGGPMSGERIAGVVALNHDAPAAYRDAAWAIEAAHDEVLVVHALGVVPEFLRRGVARFLVDRSLRAARDAGCRAVRLDVYIENRPARELYTRCGFTDLGAHTVRYAGTDLTDFHLFEYVL